ncbi:MAG: AAA family ATPase [Deltaproteobacteria bacterium]|jgi:CO dehydrogenase maturation factor|nr:AAA family ATPase [Deltaproteobacteria bacterium]MBT4267900.1 AAA family ATPase [Deltaproteobacteria bacterium]MBT4642191.1 AAA family ATPase [Deltaproteobacteria bacterium]MBT6499358.1 AAA family ATPase [Deltaproteobacteria bacterium]MBT6612233.1 AAA family ATPase [Deltaproteobacteria bacterium]
MVKAAAETGGLKVLAIDADPAIGLSFALGVEVTKTVDHIRRDLIEKIEGNKADDKAGTLQMLDYELFDALVEADGFSLLAIGRSEGEGCYCQVNNLLKDIIESLADNFDVIIIDGEAGVEQINRRVLKRVDHLVLVSDTSAKGLKVAATIRQVACDGQAVDYMSTGLLLNRIRDNSEVDAIMNGMDLELLGWLPEDEQIRTFDFSGKPYVDFPVISKTYIAISELLKRISN